MNSSRLPASALLEPDLLANVVRTSPTAIAISDPNLPDNPLVFVNEAFCKLTGYDEADIIGRNCRFLQGPDSDDVEIALLRDAITNRQPVEATILNYAKNGSPFWNRLSISPLFDDAGELKLFFSSQYDATIEQHTQDSLREAQQRLDALVRSSSEVRFNMNKDWTELYQLAGGDFIPDTVSANPNWLVEYIPPDSIDDVRAEFERAIATKSTYVIEHRVNRVDGGVGWAFTRAVPLFDDNGEITGWFGAASDITDRKHAEAALKESESALRELNSTLERRIADAVAERTKVEDQLRQSQKLEAIGQLTGGVAHDFNNLLMVIRSSADLLKKPNLPDDRRDRYIKAISDTVERAAKLTGQLLSFARRQALKPEVFDVCDSVRALSDMMGTLIGSRITITTDLYEDQCFALVDPSQFDTALVNMAINARDAMDGAGRIELAVKVVGSVLSSSIDPSADCQIAVSLSDTGSGIPADKLERIFEPFFTTKEMGKGTGLGLSQVFGFAKQSGGDIKVESTVGEGTKFTLYLPRVASAPLRAEPVAEMDPLAEGHDTSVLVVEDNSEVAAFAIQTLNDLGYLTVHAESGELALAELAEGADRFDVVFTDVLMPGISGIELAQQVQRLYVNLPVVLTSGYSEVLAQNGTYGFELLQKPYSVEQLSQILRKAIALQLRS